MHIVMLAARPAVHGPIPTLAALLADALGRRGCEVVVLPWGRKTEHERRLTKPFTRARDVVSARRIVTRSAFPLVVVHTGHSWATLARDIALVRALRGGGRAVVLHFHGSQSARLVAPGSRLFKRATAVLESSVDGLLVLSRLERERWLTFSPASRVFVVRNPRSPKLTAPTHLSGGEVPTILCVARLIEQKGVLDLVRALELVHRGTPCRLVIAGDGPEATRIRSLAGELGVADAVDLPGYVDGDDLARLYATADVFVLPTYHTEGFPTVITEAMAFGLPIVTTRMGGTPDHLADGQHAVFVPHRDPVALAAALTRILRDGDLRRRMSDANREKVRDFDPDAVADEYLAALNEIHAATETSTSGRR